MDIKSITVGAIIGAGVGGAASYAASPELLEKFSSLYAAPIISEFVVRCDEPGKCSLKAIVTANPVDSEAASAGVQSLRWSEDGICTTAAVQSFVAACGARANESAPSALIGKRHSIINGAIVEVAKESAK